MIDRHHITVANLLQDIKSENPDIYLTLKTKLRSLGLYNEDFSLQSLIQSQEKYKSLDKLEVNRLIEEAGSEVYKAWQGLFKEHEPLQVAHVTLECLGGYIRKDHKLDQ